MSYPRNAASPERLAIGAVSLIADGTVQTSAVVITVRGQGGAEGTGGGTTVYGASGIVYYTPTQAETDFTSFAVIASKASCTPVAVTIITSASVTPGTVLLAPVTHTSAVVPTVTTLTNLPSIPANWLTAAGIAAAALDGKGDWTVGKTGYSLTATTGLGNQTANISGSVTSVTGAVGSVTGAVGSVTGAVGSVTGNVGGNVTGAVGSVTGAVGSVTGAVGSVTGNVGGNVVGSVASVSAGVNATSIDGSTNAAANLRRGTLGSVLATVGAASSTTSIVTSSLDPAANVTDQFKGRIITFDRASTTVALRGQATDITASTAAGVLTVTALTTAPVSGDTFVIT